MEGVDMTACLIDGCGRPIHGRGLCDMHYQRLKKHGDPLFTAPPRAIVKCNVEGCELPTRHVGMCNAHYQKNLKYGDPLGGMTYGEPHRWLKDRVGHTGAECLIWPHGRSGDGYGALIVDGNQIGAHIEMCRLAHGEKPFEKAVVRHFVCENGKGACVHPEHICWGTAQENMDDRSAHGTTARGERSGSAKLDDPTVALIRAEITMGRTQLSVAEECGVSQSAISDIVNNRTWQ